VPLVRVSHDGFIGHAEPALAVDPRNPLHLLAAAQIVPPGDPAGDRRQLGTFLSVDGGRSWRSNGALPGSSPRLLGLDVSVAFDSRGTGYVLGEEQRSVRDPVAPLYLWRALAGGRRFAAPLAVAGGPGCCDHAWLAIDRTRGARAGMLYVAYTTVAAVVVRRSIDGGRHWSPATTVPVPASAGAANHPIGPVAAVDAGGTLHVAYFAPSSGRIVVASSSDGGTTFSASVVPGPATGTPSIAAGDSLYVTFPGARGARQVVTTAVSRDGGRSWRAPIAITAPAGANLSQPAIAASGAHVDVSFFATGAVGVDEYLATSSTNGTSFATPRRLTPTSFDPSKGLPTGKGGPFIGDYQALAVTASTVYPLWNDTRTGHLELYTARVPTA
jgi:hypothetical protein